MIKLFHVDVKLKTNLGNFRGKALDGTSGSIGANSAPSTVFNAFYRRATFI